MYVHLPAEQKGTHMSRFVALLDAHRAPLDHGRVSRDAASRWSRSSERDAGRIEMTFPFFV